VLGRCGQQCGHQLEVVLANIKKQQRNGQRE
jgi:hypothetical protein